MHKIFCACGCGKSLQQLDKYGRPHKFIRGHNRGHLGQLGLVGEKNPRWKGGIAISSGGYRLKKRGKKYVREHRLIFEKYHKCCLLPWSHVHHIDGDKQNNKIRNLQGMTHGQHSTLTHKGKSKPRHIK